MVSTWYHSMYLYVVFSYVTEYRILVYVHQYVDKVSFLCWMTSLLFLLNLNIYYSDIITPLYCHLLSIQHIALF